MKIGFLHNASLREQKLKEAVSIGAFKHGDRVTAVPYDDQARDLDFDAIAVIGVKCREWVEHCRKSGQRFLYFDKGYYYPKEKSTPGKIVNCWRASVDGAQPIEFLANAKCGEDRWQKFNVWPPPWRKSTADGHVIVAASSPKYHMFNKLEAPMAYYAKLIHELRGFTDRPIWLRPKASSPTGPIDGADEYKLDGPFEDLCHGAHAIVTYGSNAAVIGMLQGIPSIILGNGVVRPISSTDLSEIDNPNLASQEEKRQLLANLAYSQWILREWQNGSAWHHIKTTFLQ